MAITFTAGDLIGRALRLVGVIAQAEQAPADVAQDALVILNGLVDGFATQRLSMPASSRQVFPTVDGTSTYSIGPGGDWDTVRPVSIDQASILASAIPLPFEIPLQPLVDQSYNVVTVKTLASAFPVAFYYNATFPLGTVYLWPTPLQSAVYQVVLYVGAQLTTFAGLTTAVTMAPGYERMLRYNLAVECALQFQAPPVNALTLKLAQDSLADVKRINLEQVDLGAGAPLPGSGGVYNIWSDTNA